MDIDSRLQDIILPFDKNRIPDIAILGFPFDEGVRRNGGRIGANEGPSCFRKYMRRICSSDAQKGVDLSQLFIQDWGDISPTLSLEEAHEQLTEKISLILNQDACPFIVGGGNDQSYPNSSALLTKCIADNKSFCCINIDAHLDVRPLKENKVHSGSPFRQLLQDCRFIACENAKFYEFASQPMQCSMEHVKFVKDNGGEIYWLSDIQNAASLFWEIIDNFDGYVFVSFDLDAIRASDAPGVSCSSPVGLTSVDALKICYLAGKNPKVKMFDLSEYNPKIEDYMTGRLVAMMFHSFLSGFTRRKINKLF